MNKLKVVEMAIDEVIPYENNPRNNDDAVDPVAESIKEFGFKVPIVIDKNNVIVSGHTRLKAAKKLGFETVPVIKADDLTDEQVRAFRLADNKTGELASWDLEKLEEELSGISIDMAQFGFEDLEKELTDYGVEEVETPSVPDEPKAKLGDLYQLGEHLLMCGDSTSEESMKKLFGGGLAALVFTDPPYGVSLEEKNATLDSFGRASKIREKQDIEGDDIPINDLYETLVKAFTNLRQNGADEDCTYYVTSPQGGELGLMMMLMMKDAGLPVRHMLIWVKNSATFSLGRLDYDYRHEPIFYTWTKKHNFYGGYNTTVIDDTTVIDKMKRKELIELIHKLMFPKDDSVMYCDKPLANNLHPTMKPIKLISKFILNSSKEGDIVGDIFGGSGSTLIACEQLHRKCRMMELDPKYVDVIIKRWEDFTGKKAVKVG